jgi:hypothetical protein
MPGDRHGEKTHHECKCSDCNKITAMAERLDAWKAAESLLLRDGEGRPRKWGGEGDDELVVGPDNVLLLSNWLLYGPEEDN